MAAASTASSSFRSARIVSRRAGSPTVTLLQLEVVDKNNLKTFFQPGQWVDFRVPSSQQWTGGFSIASSPAHLPRMTLAVKRSRQAPAQWVTHQAQVNDEVSIRVGGDCVLLNDDKKLQNRPHVFVAGGIGISPILSMYRQHVEQRNNERNEPVNKHKTCWCLYSVSTEEELVFVDELQRLSQQHGDRLVLALTRQSQWTTNNNKKKAMNGVLSTTTVEYKTGRVMTDFLQQAPIDAVYYLCGPPSMLDDAVDLLQSRGVDQSNMRYEKWW